MKFLPILEKTQTELFKDGSDSKSMRIKSAQDGDFEKFSRTWRFLDILKTRPKPDSSKVQSIEK